MICITGAGGTVGSAVLEALEYRGVAARAAFFTAAKAAAARDRGLDAVTIDYQRPETVEAAFHGCERVFLLGPNVTLQARLEQNAVAGAMAAGVRHVVKLSVMDADGGDYLLGDVHRVVETALRQSGMSWAFLRPNSFMQNVQTFMLTTIAADAAFYTASGSARVAHVDVRDIAAVAAEALTNGGHDGKAYTLTGPAALTYDEVAEALSAAAGRTIRHVDLAPAELESALIASGMPEPVAVRLVDLERYFRAGGAGAVTDDVRTVTGRPPHTFAQYAAEIAALLKSAG